MVKRRPERREIRRSKRKENEKKNTSVFLLFYYRLLWLFSGFQQGGIVRNEALSKFTFSVSSCQSLVIFHFFSFLYTYPYHHHHFIYNSSQKRGRKPGKRRSKNQEKKETTYIKTRFDNYKQGKNRNDRKWEDLGHFVVK